MRWALLTLGVVALTAAGCGGLPGGPGGPRAPEQGTITGRVWKVSATMEDVLYPPGVPREGMPESAKARGVWMHVGRERREVLVSFNDMPQDEADKIREGATLTVAGQMVSSRGDGVTDLVLGARVVRLSR